MTPVLGNTAKTTSLYELPPRATRFILQSEARRLLPTNRIIHCLRTAASHGGGRVQVIYRPGERRAFYKGLQTCGQLWVCPVCAQKISETRRRLWLGALSVEDEQVVTGHAGRRRRIKRPRYRLTMLTFTIRHSAALSLKSIREQLNRVYGRFWGGSWAQDFHAANATVGTLRSLEVTHGESGWHPHIHALIISRFGDESRFFNKSEPELKDRWSRMADRCGLYASVENGLTVVPAGLKVIEYVNKIGEHVVLDAQERGGVTEVSKAVTKHGRGDSATLTDLLARSFVGDARSSSLWARGTEDMFGARHIVASRGLLRAVNANQAAVDDLLASHETPETSDKVLATIENKLWREIVRRNLVHNVLAIGDFGDAELLSDFLAELPDGNPTSPAEDNDWGIKNV